MTNRIIELAREAGLKVGTNISGVTLFGSPAEMGLAHIDIDEMEAFAALVRNAALEEAAGVCDDKHDEWRFGDGEDSTSGPKDCAVAIRQLKDKT